jgi:hypothetical protein
MLPLMLSFAMSVLARVAFDGNLVVLLVSMLVDVAILAPGGATWRQLKIPPGPL